MTSAAAFDDFAAAKTRAAQAARIHPLQTVTVGAASELLPQVGNPWTRGLYGGGFHLVPPPDDRLPAVSLVFVQSREKNTGAANPADLGGGEADKHLIYEGLSRVAADAVMAGATTAGGKEVFFSVWHPEIVSLRAELGLPRHPAQVVATGTGCIDVGGSLVFNVPDVPVYLLATPRACDRLGAGLSARPWVRVVPIAGDELRPPIEVLRDEFGIRRISAVGGRTLASALLDAGLVQDICLTTTERSGGEPDTPFYVGGQQLALTPIVTKRATDRAAPFVFEHLAVAGH